MKREFSTGGVVYKIEGGRMLWLIARSSPSSDYPESYWRLTKGWLDDSGDGKSPGPLARGERKASEEELQKGALREVREEGGVKAKIVGKIGTERYLLTSRDEKRMKFVTFYLMKWAKDVEKGPGFETSEVEWLVFNEARKRLKYSGEKDVLAKAQALLGERNLVESDII